jgi:hypothetical protein
MVCLVVGLSWSLLRSYLYVAFVRQSVPGLWNLPFFVGFGLAVEVADL